MLIGALLLMLPGGLLLLKDLLFSRESVSLMLPLATAPASIIWSIAAYFGLVLPEWGGTIGVNEALTFYLVSDIVYQIILNGILGGLLGLFIHHVFYQDERQPRPEPSQPML